MGTIPHIPSKFKPIALWSKSKDSNKLGWPYTKQLCFQAVPDVETISVNKLIRSCSLLSFLFSLSLPLPVSLLWCHVFLNFPIITFSYNVFYFLFFFFFLMWIICKVFTELVTVLLLYCVLGFWPEPCGILGIEPAPSALEGKVLTTATPKAVAVLLFFNFFFCVFQTSVKLTMNLVRKSISKMSLFKNLLHCSYLNSAMKTSIQNNSNKNETERAHPTEMLPLAWLCCKMKLSLALPHFILIVS